MGCCLPIGGLDLHRSTDSNISRIPTRWGYNRCVADWSEWQRLPTAPSRSSSARRWSHGAMFHAVVHPGARVALADELDVNALDRASRRSRPGLARARRGPSRSTPAGCPSSTPPPSPSSCCRDHLVAAARRRRLHWEHLSRPVASVLGIDLRHILMDPPSSDRRVRGDRLCNPPD